GRDEAGDLAGPGRAAWAVEASSAGRTISSSTGERTGAHLRASGTIAFDTHAGRRRHRGRAMSAPRIGLGTSLVSSLQPRDAINAPRNRAPTKPRTFS